MITLDSDDYTSIIQSNHFLKLNVFTDIAIWDIETETHGHHVVEYTSFFFPQIGK